MCSLCELKTILKVYDDSDPRWIIMDCMSCILPMSVWRGKPLHTMEIPKKDYQEMEEALIKIGEEKDEKITINIFCHQPSCWRDKYIPINYKKKRF